MFSIKYLLFLVSAVSALAIHRRDATEINEDLDEIESGIVDLGAAVRQYAGSNNSSPETFQLAAASLEDAINSATENARFDNALNDNEAASLLDELHNRTAEYLDITLEAFEYMVHVNSEEDDTLLAEPILVDLEADFLKYGDALADKMPPHSVSSMEKTTEDIAEDIHSTLESWESEPDDS